MERKILKEKMRRLRAWIMVFVTVVSCLFGNAAMDVWAATDMSISYDLNDFDDETSDAKITSTGYTESISYDGSSNVEVTLPTATRTGYVFVEWNMAASGNEFSYNAGEVTLKAEELDSAAEYNQDTIFMTAQWREENKINITYASDYGTLETTSEVFRESTNSTDGAAVITLPDITDAGYNCTFIGWKCYEADANGNKGNEVTTFASYREDIASEYENITVGGYAAETDVSIEYPTDENNAGGNTAYYIFEAQFVEKKAISYLFNYDDIDAKMPETEYVESVDFYGTTAETVTLPTATKENAFFVEWGVADSGGNLLTDFSGNTYTYPAGEATFSAEALQAASGYDAGTIYLVGSFTDAKSIIVTYNVNGGIELTESQITAYQVNATDTVVTFTLAETPIREGYTFKGWMSSLDNSVYGAKASVSSELKNGDITFIAQWEENKSTINLTYDVGGGAITSTDYTKSLSIGELAQTATVENLPVAEKEGYFFTGWTCDTDGVSYDAEKGTLTWDENAKAVTEINFTANYQKAKGLVVKYDANDEGATDVTQTKYEQQTTDQTSVTFTLATAPTREGYTFTGWLSSVDNTIYQENTSVSSELTDGEITFTAQWEKTNCTINLTYDAGDGAITSTDYTKTLTVWELDTTASIAVLPVAEKEGYFFTGWVCNTAGVSYANGTLTWDTNAGSVTNITLTATYEEIDKLIVNYNANGGTTVDGSPVTVYQKKLGDTTVTFNLAAAPTREGYTFLGWKCDLDGDSTTYYEAEKEVTYALINSAITFTAQWEEIKNTINLTYDAGDGEITSTDHTTSLSVWELATTVTIAKLPEVTQNGYFFTGWTCDTEGVSYDAETGTLDLGTTAKNITDITFTANYEKIEELTVTYDANDEGATEETKVVYALENIGDTSVTFTLAKAPEREGYTFLGWKSSEEPESTTYYQAGTEVTYELTVGEITFTAQWEETECTINLTYDAGDGKISSTDYTESLTVWELTQTTTVETLPVAEKEGYFFTGWVCEIEGVSYDPETGTLTWTTNAKSAKEITLKANYVEIDFITVNYDANGGENTITTPVIVYQATAEDSRVEFMLADAPVKDGYTFLGWADSSNTDEVILLQPGTCVVCDLSTEPLTFIAQWEEIECTINLTYDAGDGKISSTDYTENLTVWELAQTATVETLPVAEKEGCFFTGWTCDTDGVSYDAETGTLTWTTNAKATKEITLKANYEKIEELTVKYEANDEGATAGTKVVYKQEIAGQTNVAFTLAKAPEREGYTFLGWQSSLDTNSDTYYQAGATVTFNLTSSEITFIAQWEETDCTISIDYAIANGNITSNNYTPSISVWELATSAGNIVLPEVERTGFLFAGWMFETGVSYNDENGVLSWGSPAIEIGEITISARWTQIISGGTLSLKATEKYHLDEGNWTVDGDNTVYVGGNDVYVSESGDYEFSEAE